MYASELRDAVLNLQKVNRRLRRAVPSMRGFSVLYQPQADRGGAIVGAEALLRWDPRCGHAIGPNIFIPSLERSRLIVPVGQWVIAQALTQLVAFRAAGVDLQHISVNVSAKQLLPGFAEFVVDAVRREGLQPADLVLELTESQAIADSGRSADSIRALADAGFAWEIDDFGAGYASMRWLRKLAFKGIKLDRSLLVDPNEPPEMVHAICGMARALGMRVTCEGVETQEQLSRVLDAGVHCVQGYLVGRPTAPDAFSSRQGWHRTS